MKNSNDDTEQDKSPKPSTTPRFPALESAPKLTPERRAEADEGSQQFLEALNRNALADRDAE